MAEAVLYVFAEAVVSNLVDEAIEQASKFKNRARSVLRYKKDIDELSRYLHKLRALVKHAMPDSDRLEGSSHVEDPQHKTFVKALYDIAQDSEDLIQDCQYEKKWRRKVLLPFTVGKRLEDLKRRIEILESKASPCTTRKMRSPSISPSVESTTCELRRTTLRLASMRRNSFNRRLQPVEVDPVGLDDLINEVQRLLIEDEATYIFGIHGMGGSGKSFLMKCLWNSEEVQNAFENDSLIWVPVSTGQLSWLQRTIAKNLRMDFSGSWSEEEAKTEIYRHLENRRFFMVLDGVWPYTTDHFLEALGVPTKSVKGSKIAVISRDREYLMKIKPNMSLIEMNHLSEEDSWTLFRTYAFGSGGPTLAPEVSQAARKAASTCQGHPLALKAYGAAMAGKREPWQWQLTDHGQGSPSSSYTDPESRVLQCLHSSYESLSPEIGVAFLYFAAFPENHVVRTADLIDLWTAERLIRAESPSKSDADGRQLLNKMIDRCVVEGVEAGSLGRVRKCKMHPMFRHLAICILQNEKTEEGRSLFQAGENLKDFPTKEINKYRRISLMYTGITSLPKKMKKCPKLRTLILRHSHGLCLIPPKFLKRLTWLRTLDLSMTGIESLPATLERLTRLEYLNLSRTKLRSLPLALTRLDRLTSLNLFECKELECLPAEMSKLEHLRYLNLRRCCKLKFLPFQVTLIASLQCLIMDGCYSLQWKLSDQNSPNVDTRHFSQLQDLRSLCNLRYLSFVCSNSAIPDGLMSNFVEMERLEICSTRSENLPEDILHMKFIADLRLSRFERLLNVPEWLCGLKSLRRITLEYLNVKALPSGLFETLPWLRLLEIENCDELSELPEEFGKRDAFPALEELRVERLKALKELPALEETAMKMLKELRVRFCEGVSRFPVGVEKLRRNTRIDINGSWGLIASAGEDGVDRHRVTKFLNTITY